MKPIPYGHQYIDSEDIGQVVGALKSDWLTQGPKVREFESALCKYTGAKYAVAVSSGTAALHLSCLASGIKEGDEVITSPITFVASANCVLYCQGKPVFADIEENTGNISPEEIEKKITNKTKAVIPVHFSGQPCRIQEIYKIAKKYNLIIIEDACHALGAEYKAGSKWVKIGSCRHSDLAVFSFHPVKSITTGEGGAVCINNRDYYERLLMLRNHGITRNKAQFQYSDKRIIGDWYYEMQALGFNYRITDLQCTLGISQLKKLPYFLGRREEIVSIYQDGLSGVGEIELPSEGENIKSAWHLYCIRLRFKTKVGTKRINIFNYLRKKGIGVNVHYIPVYLHPYYQEKFGDKYGACLKAEDYYKRTLTLPLYPSLKEKEIKTVINLVTKAIALENKGGG